MKILICCVLALSVVEVFSQGATDCPVRIQRLPHLKVYTDVCMLLVTNKVTGDDAKRSCARMGGRLVEIKDPDKEKFVLQSLNQEHWTEDNIWIGANDKVHEGDWRWEDGTKVTFNRFADGQGSNHNTGFLFADGRGEDCAVIRRDDGGQWHDYPCSPPVLGIGYHYTYICEFAKVQHVTPHVTHAVTTGAPLPTTTPNIDTQAPTTMPNVETPPPTTMPNVETPPPTTMPNVETPPPTTMPNVETPPPTTMPNVETPPPTTMPNVETPQPTVPQRETPPPTVPQRETPPPTVGHTNKGHNHTPHQTTVVNIETPAPTMPQRETPPPTQIIGRR